METRSKMANKELLEEMRTLMTTQLTEQGSRIHDTLAEFKQDVQNQVQTIGEQIHTVEKAVTSAQVRITQLEDELSRLRLAEGQDSGRGHIVTSHPGPRAPPYDGSGSWPMYRRQFEAAARVNKWTGARKATELVVALRGPALSAIQSVPSDKQEQYEAISDALELRYGDEHLRDLYRAQLRGRSQRSGESLQEFAAEIERLSYLAYPDMPREFAEQQIIDTFTDGIRDSNIRQGLRLARHRKVKDVVACALEIDAGNHTSPRTSQVREVQTAHEDGLQEAVNRILAAVDDRRRQGSPSRTYKDTIRCWGCGQLGHLRRDCKQPGGQGTNAHSSEN